MLKRFQKLLVYITAAMAMLVNGLPAMAADKLDDTNIRLSESRDSQSSNYTFSTKAKTSGTIKGIKMKFRRTASTGEQHPTTMTQNSSAKGTMTGGLTAANYTLDRSTDAATGILYLQNTTGDIINTATAITWEITGMGNPSISATDAGCTPSGNSSSGTCYVRILTFNTDVLADLQAETSANILDTATVSYTVTSDVTVTATVDPSLTFTVTGVASGLSANGQTTSATSTFITLPFGNIATNAPKYLAHDLTVRTNATKGYQVTMKMRDDMTGTYAANNIDPYIGNSATWAAPQAWTSPTSSTANENTGWIGANTPDTDVSGWSSPSGLWGPVNGTENQVMLSSGPDIGSVATRISYAIETDVYQPADNYTGYLVYNCIPTY
ncbi:hypothetical protein COZ22_02465 [bacterium (Candidatus Howlettbacteria) CG_4_10_14_3_um_filter_37_10]|nr:MAG: hypothetical protein COX25_02725 [bacterium (Candidatus Howlettbacteria) CG23_combo_of_CG06-09_8_20_14_all_37_9]PIX99467.1 MAG: hypothetical protein COZ22_02465 [bacterium (Candidatus Howlettbacteria) CG_4_10_14_3_um_filter_37_10]PJB07340.1 MAG: hypothetical protein CO123_00305 [bacterium (Candidatus Howlettbacteria) CG_4_9_14_3_um_filter_37_10]